MPFDGAVDGGAAHAEEFGDFEGAVLASVGSYTEPPRLRLICRVVSVGAGQVVVDVDPLGLDTEAEQGVALSGEVLLVGGATGVPDQPDCHPDARLLNSDALVVILMTMTFLSLAEVKSHLSELVGRVNSQHERVTVTVHGKPSAVLIATEDLESLEETIAILSDPDTLSRLAASEAELTRGEGESEEQLAHAMNERRRLRA